MTTKFQQLQNDALFYSIQTLKPHLTLPQLTTFLHLTYSCPWSRFTVTNRYFYFYWLSYLS